jgi:hypothetical protein
MHAHSGIVLGQLDRMTDSTELVQHATYSVPQSGYAFADAIEARRRLEDAVLGPSKQQLAIGE